MVKAAASERRQWIRAKRVMSIQYRLVKARQKNFDDSWCLSMTHDMSVGGLSFFTDREFRKNDLLELHVIMSGVLEIYNGFGKVVRVEKKKTGAYFLTAVKFVDKQLKARKVKSYITKPRSKKKKKSTKKRV